jgi:hypothetical protein
VLDHGFQGEGPLALDLGFRNGDRIVLDSGHRNVDLLALDLRLPDVMETRLRSTLAFKMATGPGCVRFRSSRWRLDCVNFLLAR